jgi:hypothetical protein
MRSCAALHRQLRAHFPDLAEDPDALGMLQAIAVATLRPRVGSRMPTAGEGATPGLSLGAAEAVAAARLAAAGLAHDVMVATSIMAQGIECAPWDHLRGVPAQLWVLPAVCSAVSPDEFFSAEALAEEPPPASYWYNGERGTLWFRLAYEIRALRPGISDGERKQFRDEAYENWLEWTSETHELSEDYPDPWRSSTFDVSFTENAFAYAAHAQGVDLGTWADTPETALRLARDDNGLGQMRRQTLQAAHLYHWAALESHLLLTASDDLDAVLREHPWIAQWYPEALEDPAHDPAPIWPPDKQVLARELQRRLTSRERSRPWADVQSDWLGLAVFNVESGLAVVTTNTDFPQCSCGMEAILETSAECGACGRPAATLVTTAAGAGDGYYPVYCFSDGDGNPHGALAVFDLAMATLGVGRPFSPAGLVDLATPAYCGTIENHGSLSFCDAVHGTDSSNIAVDVPLPPGRYHVVAWEGEDGFTAIAAYDQAAMDALTALVGPVGRKVWEMTPD